jgi:hypothetical protein
VTVYLFFVPKITFSVFSVFSGGKNQKRQSAEAVCVGSTDGRLPTGGLGTPTKHTDCATPNLLTVLPLDLPPKITFSVFSVFSGGKTQKTPWGRSGWRRVWPGRWSAAGGDARPPLNTLTADRTAYRDRRPPPPASPRGPASAGPAEARGSGEKGPGGTALLPCVCCLGDGLPPCDGAWSPFFLKYLCRGQI